MTEYLGLSYFVIGCIVLVYDWNKFYAKEYSEAKKNGEVQDSMAIIYMILVIMLWPFKLFQYLAKYNY